MKKVRVVLMAFLLAISSVAVWAVDVCDPPSTTTKQGDFGNDVGIQQAVIWEAFNDCPNTHWYRQYSLDFGASWLFPSTLGTTSGILSNGVFVPQYTHFFFLPPDTLFLTRAVPYNGNPPVPPLVAGQVYTLTYPDGTETTEVIVEAVPEVVKPKGPKKPRRNPR